MRPSSLRSELNQSTGPVIFVAAIGSPGLNTLNSSKKNVATLYIKVKFVYICCMKKNTTLEMVAQSEKVSLYSISFEKDRTTEFERFMLKFESESSLNRDFLRIIYALQKIMEEGALERFFRPEGSMKDNVCALPIESGKLRLYCLRLSDRILIIGNGGIKETRTYQEDETLLGYVMDLQKFDLLLKQYIEKGWLSVEEKQISGADEMVFSI